MSNFSGRNHTRQHIAHLAARMMAEDGIEDFAVAKRKAARNAGISDGSQLPDNEEIHRALEIYRALYCQEHAHELRALRESALNVMDEVMEFNPHLMGSVLKGNAGKFAVIRLQLFTDDVKSVEFHLINRSIKYKNGPDRSFYAGKSRITAPTLLLERQGIDVQLIILSSRESRQTLKATPEGKPLERASRAAVAALLAAR